MLKIFIGIVLIGLLHSQNASAQAFSANVGWNSQYIYRGIPQKTSSAFGGVDMEAGNAYAGAWAADVGDGLEIDYYAGYGFNVADFDFSLGGTWYTYTGDFDDKYLELNLAVGWKFLTFDAAIGQYDNFAGPTLNYQFYTVTTTYAGFYAKIGAFEDDFQGAYYEAGYGDTLVVNGTNLIDYGFALIRSNSKLLGGEAGTNAVFTLTKTFP